MHFPKLLDSPTVSEEDKRKIAELLKKPWNPHFRRHTSATENSKRIKDPVLINRYFGWSQKGNTRLWCQHYGSNDAIEAMLIADGLVSPDGASKNKRDLLKPKQCPNCDEPNKPESKFCSKCRFVLSYDAFNETLEDKSKAAKEAEETKKN